GTKTDYLMSVLEHEQTHIQHPLWGEKIVEWYQLRGSHPESLSRWSEKTVLELTAASKKIEPELPPDMTRGY
ncbi:hypothetical protein, partial [Klebsiella pneumoniae]